VRINDSIVHLFARFIRGDSACVDDLTPSSAARFNLNTSSESQNRPA
jgi:hypothetical protein